MYGDGDYVYKHAFDPGPRNDVSLWWVDDCFKNKMASQYGGYLAIGIISQNEKYEGILNDIQARFNTLLDIARAESINLRCCSPEFAERHWRDYLNKSENAVLIDLHYDPPPDGDDPGSYGIRFYLRMADKYPPIRATCSFFSVKTSLVNDWMSSGADWVPSILFTIDKTETQVLRSQVRQLINYVKDHHFTGASHWSPEEWSQMRTEAWEVCCEFGPDSDEGPFNAHHLPDGGTSVKDEEEDELASRLKERLSDIGGGAIYRLPDHSWGETDEDLPVWDRPPIRAIGQFDQIRPRSLLHFRTGGKGSTKQARQH